MKSLKAWLKKSYTFINIDYLARRLDIKYLTGVISKLIFEYNHPDTPWLTGDMILILKNYLKPDDVGVEFGSGQSTSWFASTTKKLISVEHDPYWYKRTKKALKTKHLNSKVNYFLIEDINENNEKDSFKYTSPLKNVRDNSLDYCLVDGLFREQCILDVIPKLKKGGVIIMDNSESYFPKNIVSVSIRYKFNTNPAYSKKRQKMIDTLKTWRCIWTSDAVQDTAMWFKP